MDHSGAATESTTRNWASAAAQRQHQPTPTPNIMGSHNSNRTEGPGANTAFPTAALPTSPTEDPEDTPPLTPSTENTGDVRHQIQATQEPTIATLGANLEALANLQVDELQKLIKSLHGMAAARTGTTPTAPTTPTRPRRDNRGGGSNPLGTSQYWQRPAARGTTYKTSITQRPQHRTDKGRPSNIPPTSHNTTICHNILRNVQQAALRKRDGGIPRHL